MMELNWTIESLLSWTEKYFIRNSISDARLEAEVLLSFVVGCPRLNLHIRKDEMLSKDSLKRFKKLIIQRQKRIPVSYITGEHEFFGLKIFVNEHTLIPRPETELLVEEALKVIKENKLKLVADICSGSGCIAIALAKFSGIDRAFAADISQEALRVLFQNASNQNVLARVVIKKGDSF